MAANLSDTGGFHQRLVTLLGPRAGLLRTQTQPMKALGQVIGVVAHSERAVDEVRHSRERPALSRETAGARPCLYQPCHLPPFVRAQLRRPARARPRLQPAGTAACFMQSPRPAADGSLADTHAARYLHLRQVPPSQESSGRKPPLLKLLGRPVLWLPRHGPPLHDVTPQTLTRLP